VFTSADAGATWLAPSRSELVPFNEAIAVSADGIVYVGSRNGLYRSADQGQSWDQLLAGARVLSLAASAELLLVGTERDGVLRSEDHGRSFSGANAGLIDLSVIAIAVSPAFEQDGTAFVATTSGLYRTRNGGKSWRPLDVDAAAQCLCISQDGLVLAGTESDGLLRSNDGGTHWEPVSTLLAASVTAIAHSRHSGTTAVATDQGIAISENSSESWTLTGADLGPVLAVHFASTDDGEVLLAGLYREGVTRAVDPFDRWSSSNAGLQARLLPGLTLSPSFETDQSLFAAGPDDGVLVSTDSGRTWSVHLNGPDDPRVSGIAANRTSLFGATDAGVLRSQDRGRTWSVVMGQRAATAVLVSDSGRIIAALSGGRLLASDDNGNAWRATGADFDAEITAVACAPDRSLFVATRADDELTVWRCTADGLIRERWLVKPGRDHLAVAAYGSMVYVGAGSQVLSPIRDAREVRSGEQRPLWRGVDVGATITALATTLDAQRRRVAFAATSAGVYVSRDGGETFAACVGSNHGPGATLAIAVSPNYAQDGLVYTVELNGTIWCYSDTDQREHK
jgi:photosystem II stability/assembly factor-like uncharacterized protein